MTLSKPFYIGVFEMTQAQYNYVMGSNPSNYKGDTRPVEYVSWDTIRGSVAGAAFPAHTQVDPTSFMGKLRLRTGCLFDLPTEAQWEYACRAGTSSGLNNGLWTTSGSDEGLKQVARCWLNQNDSKGGYSQHAVVGSYMPNQWGIYDMHGNVFEWCLDWWKSNLGSDSVVDPVGPRSPDNSYGRICRGGAWWVANGHHPELRSGARNAAISARNTSDDTAVSYSSEVDSAWGFRVACIPVVQ